MNASKLKMHHICFAQGRLHYGKGSISCALGQLDYQPQGLKTVGIPCVMGESPKSFVEAAADLFVHVLARVRRTKPSCILALRVLLSCAVSSMDYRLTLVPLTSKDLQPALASSGPTGGPQLPGSSLMVSFPLPAGPPPPGWSGLPLPRDASAPATDPSHSQGCLQP